MGQPAGVGTGYSGSTADDWDLLYRQIPIFSIPQAEALVERDGRRIFPQTREDRGCGNRKEGNFFFPGYDRGFGRSYGNGEYRRGGGGFGDRRTGRDFLDVGGGPVWDDDYFRRECPWLPLPAKKQKRRVGGRPDVLSLERASQPLFGGPVFFPLLGWAT